jgi:hypothetical protein
MAFPQHQNSIVKHLYLHLISTPVIPTRISKSANAMSSTAQSTILKELGIQLPELDATKGIRGPNTRESKAAQWPMVQRWYVVLLLV